MIRSQPHLVGSAGYLAWMDWDKLLGWFAAAEGADLDGTFAGVELAAHAFAAAETVYEGARPPRAPGPLPRVRGLAQAVARLRTVGSEHRYEALLHVLVACEGDLSDPARRAGLPVSTALDPASGLAGVVHHAWKGQAVWRATQHRRREAVGPGPTSYALRPGDQLDHLWLAWDRGAPLGYTPLAQRGLASRRVVTALGERLGAGSLRVALCPLLGSPGPQFRVGGAGDTFSACREHAPVDERALADVFAHAREQEISLLLLPELHVRPEELPALAGAGGPVLMVAGSFHVADGEGLRNRAPVLVDGGHRLWGHDKRGYFRVVRSVASAAPFEAAAVVAEEVCEGIVGGGALTVLDTSLGRIAVVICADVLDTGGYVRAIEDARPEILLIVSLSPDTRPFEAFAEHLERHGISTLYVNAARPPALLAMCWLALHGSGDLPPTRVRWPAGGILEAWDRKQKWKAAPGSVAWIDPVLGMVVDLGAMVRDGKVDAQEAN